MSFPVPTRYNLTDAKNETVVVYNDGREEALLPWVDGAGGEAMPGEIITTLYFEPTEEIYGEHQIELQLKPMANGVVGYVCVGLPEELTYTSAYGFCAIIGNGSEKSTLATNISNTRRISNIAPGAGLVFAAKSGILRVPFRSGVMLPGYKYLIYQIKGGE